MSYTPGTFKDIVLAPNFLESKVEGHVKTQPSRLDIFFAETLLRLVPRRVTPNEITVFRFLMIPVVLAFLVSGHIEWGLGAFALAALSDALDGAKARVYHEVTDWGKMYDPLADKLLIGSVVAIFVTRYIGPVLTVAVISVEVLLILNAFYRKRRERAVVQAQVAGKIKMTLQCAGVLLLLWHASTPSEFALAGATYILYAALGFAIVSLFVYRSV